MYVIVIDIYTFISGRVGAIFNREPFFLAQFSRLKIAPTEIYLAACEEFVYCYNCSKTRLSD